MSTDTGGPGPPDTDTGQFVDIASCIRGAVEIINQSDQPMDINQHIQNQYSNKRPGDVIPQTLHPCKQSNIAKESGKSDHVDNLPDGKSDAQVNPTAQVRKQNKYKITDSGPYLVFVQKKNFSRLHPMSIGKLLYTGSFAHKQNIIKIDPAGRSKIKIETNNALIANKLTTLDILNNEELETYIPDFNVFKLGVIKYVDTSITDDEIMNFTASNQKIVSVRRILKRINSNEKKTTQTCILKFEGQQLPNYITLFGTRCEVEPYVSPVIQCYNCLRYGHMSQQCRSHLRCSRCSKEHKLSECEADTMSCIYCKGYHLSTDRKCTEYAIQKSVKKLMAYDNLSYAQAVRQVKTSYANITNERRPDINSATEFPYIDNTVLPSTSSDVTHNQENTNQKRNFRISQVIHPKPKHPVARLDNSDLVTGTHPVITPSAPIIHNPYSAQYHRLPHEDKNNSLFKDLKQKLFSMIETVIEKTKNNVLVSADEVKAQINNLDDLFPQLFNHGY